MTRVYVDNVRPNFCEQTLAEGNDVASWFRQEGERYIYDHKLLALGWQQWDTDQDAWYFGVWVHVELRQTFCYAEGDCTQTFCPTVEHFRARIAALWEAHPEHPPAMVVLDFETLTRTNILDARLRPEDVT
jgi:hypothetical protein